MDIKHKSILRNICERVTAGYFREEDVLLFWLLVREHGDKTIRAFGDFAAHRYRDRGLPTEYLSTINKIIEDLAAARPFTAVGFLFTPEGIAQSLNGVLAELDLPRFDAHHSEHVIICTVSALQGARIEADGLTEPSVLRMECTPTQVELKASLKSGKRTGAVTLLRLETSALSCHSASPPACYHVIVEGGRVLLAAAS